MDGFTLIDGIVALVIVISAILAYSRGLVRELMAIAGWVGAAILAFILAPKAEPLIKQIPKVGDYLGDSCQLSIIVAFAAVFAVALVIFSLFTPLLSSLIQRSALGGIDQGLGFIFGAARGVLLVAVALIVYDRVVASETIPMIDNSRTMNIFSRAEENVNAAIPTEAPKWIEERYKQLTSSCEI